MSDSDDLPMCDTCGTYAEWCQCPPAPPERAILQDLIAELRAENEWHFTAMANRAEARLSEVSPTTTVALGTQSTIDIIESTSNTLDPDLAEQIRQAWLTETGRRCILLAGFRYAGTVEVQGE